MGYTPNISEYIQHSWYDWVWFNDPRDPAIQRLGRWLGLALTANQDMAYHILTKVILLFVLPSFLSQKMRRQMKILKNE